MTEMKKLLEEKRKLQSKLSKINDKIAKVKDGFEYKVCVISYGSKSWEKHYNAASIEELANKYGDGVNGVIDVYTDNPKAHEIPHHGCLSVYGLLQAPKE